MGMTQPFKTLHACGGPVFGRLSPKGQCARCDELRAGAKARQGYNARAKADEARFRRELAAHDCKRSGCMMVCTFGDY